LIAALTGYILLLHYISTSKVQVGLWVGVVHVAKKPAGEGSAVWSSESLALVLVQLFASMPLVDLIEHCYVVLSTAMKSWFFACLWSLGFCIINSACSNINNPNGLIENVIPASSGTLEQQRSPNDLLSAFRMHYQRFEQAVQEVVLNPTDATVLARLGDDVDEFTTLVTEVSQMPFYFKQPT
jgi:hypothetical protein